jgi:arylsulfatase A-like enzyme
MQPFQLVYLPAPARFGLNVNLHDAAAKLILKAAHGANHSKSPRLLTMPRLVFPLLVALLSGLLDHSARAADPHPPNVVVILMDDLGWRDLGCYGSKFYRTPHLDRLAAAGMRFTQAYAACPVCSPTRAALFTGKVPARLHLTDYIPGNFDRRKHKLLRPEFHQELPLEEVTLAERLHSVGYTTAAIGKWHLGGIGFEPERQGFDFAVGGIERGSVNSHFAPYLKDGRQLPGLSNPPAGENITERLTHEAEQFLERNAKKPFFLYLTHYAVHTPLQARPEVTAKYKDAKPDGYQRNPVYAAMIEAMDDSVGRVLKKLDELKLAENTLVVFTSDNGGLATSGQPTDLAATNNAPLREGKGYLYEGGIRVPLVARWPGKVKPATICDVPVGTIDLMPTICAACNVPVERDKDLDGVSILSLLEGAPSLDRDALYWHYPHYSPQGGRPGGAIRRGDFKLIEFYDSGRRELFNIRQDVSESQNLIEREPQLAAELADELAAWRKRVDAEMPAPNPDFVPDEQAADGTITLPAETADVHGVMLRFEPLPHKNTLGFWVRQDDWASWDFIVDRPGRFELEILQGCGNESGGSSVEFAVDGSKVNATVEETGGFQQFVRRKLGTLEITKPGKHSLTVKPQSKPGPAVMDLREVRLVPR